MNTQKKYPNSKRAFTLIELLTVIAIIGILAAILIPTVGAVRESANASRCIGNLRQIGVAMQSHASDFKGNLPVPQDDGGKITNPAIIDWWSIRWPYQLQPYLEKLLTYEMRAQANFGGVFRCPGKKEWDLNGANEGYKLSYQMSTFDRDWAGTSTRSLQRNLSQIQLPTKTALVVDAATKNSAGAIVAANPYIPNNTYLYDAYLDLRHKSKSNVLFVDGHVEALPQWGLNAYLMKESGKKGDNKLRPW